MSHPTHKRSARTSALFQHLMGGMAMAGWTPREVLLEGIWESAPSAEQVLSQKPRPNNSTILRLTKDGEQQEGIVLLDWSKDDGGFVLDNTNTSEFGTAVMASMIVAIERVESEDLHDAG